VTNNLSSRELLYTALGLGAVVLALYATRKLSETVSGALHGINPVSDQNIFYQGANAVGGVFTGQTDFSLGSWVYDITHRNEPGDITKATPVPIITRSGTLIRGADRDLIR